MTTTSLGSLDVALVRAGPMDDSVPSTVLRQRRATRSTSWNLVSHALEVLVRDLRF